MSEIPALKFHDLHKPERVLLMRIAAGEVYWINGLVRVKGYGYSRAAASTMRRLLGMSLILIRPPSRLVVSEQGRSMVQGEQHVRRSILRLSGHSDSRVANP